MTLSLRPADRAFWVLLRQVWRDWANTLIVVKPETVVGWQRQGFKLFWRWISRANKVGRPRIPREVQELIRRMARENGWGAPRIHGGLLKLGFVIDERTVSRYLPRGSTSPDQLQRWLVFLRNHRDGLVGMDFFTVPTVTFRLLWVFVVLHHERRRVMHFAVTDRPEAPWIVQQIRSGSARGPPEPGRETGEDGSTITLAESVCGAIRRNLAPRVVGQTHRVQPSAASPSGA